MPPASKRKRGVSAGTSGPKSKKGKRKSKKTYSSSEEDLPVESDAAEEDEWVVEEVVDKRIKNGVTEYFLKWKNWPSSSNTWEPIEHLENCPELVERYEATVRRQKLFEGPNGFDQGLVARAVRGVVQIEGGTRNDLCYLVEWQDHDRLEKVPSSIVREKIPQEVIKFLNTKIKWTGKKVKDNVTNGDDEETRVNNRAKESSDRMSSEGSPSKHGSDKEDHSRSSEAEADEN